MYDCVFFSDCTAGAYYIGPWPPPIPQLPGVVNIAPSETLKCTRYHQLQMRKYHWNESSLREDLARISYGSLKFAAPGSLERECCPELAVRTWLE